LKEQYHSDHIFEKKEELRRERDEINNAERKSFSCVPVDVNVAEDGEYEFTFHYYDRMVSWKPFYDIHVKNLASPLDFAFKGAISQNTGEDWTDLETSLICGNLSISNNQPVLNPWHVDFVIPRPLMQASMPRNAMMAAPTAALGKQNAASASDDTVLLMAKPKAEKKTMETMESYVLPEKQVIRSGKKGSIVDITDITVPADYIYTTTPKLEPSVFLTARIRDIGIYNLYECRANIYLEGTYIGQINLDPDPTKDYNELSLGRDSQISVSRKNTRKFTEKHSRNTEHMAYEYEISIINQKNEPAVIQIRDQIPVSMNQEIKIESVDTSQGTLDPQTGEVTWFYTFQPNMPAVLKLAYSIVWPKGKLLDI